MKPETLTLGTRGSRLALRQTEQVAEMLCAHWIGLAVELRIFGTSGDARQDIPFTELADNAFTDELEHALLHHEVDAAVHSYKDLPLNSSPALTIAAIPVRADVREALVSHTGCTLAELPQGAVVGTSSARRAETLLKIRPDLELRPIRGPVDVRLEKVQRGEYDAVIFAAAGLQRLGLDEHISEYFSVDLMPPAAGQGALAVQCRVGDPSTISLLAGIDNPVLHAEVRTERERSMVTNTAHTHTTAHPDAGAIAEHA